MLTAVRKAPGQRSEQLAVTLGSTTKDLSLILGKLVDAGALKSKGVRRGTTYFPKG